MLIVEGSEIAWKIVIKDSNFDVVPRVHSFDTDSKELYQYPEQIRSNFGITTLQRSVRPDCKAFDKLTNREIK